MVDTSTINLLHLIGTDTSLVRVANINGGEYAGPCPFCGGEDRFRVWAHRDKPNYWCRQCDRKGDAIQYLMERDNLNFPEACQQLDLQQSMLNDSTSKAQYHPNRLNELRDDYIALNDDEWRDRARFFLKMTTRILHDPIGLPAREYLNQRGITSQMMVDAQLGYNNNTFAKKQVWGAADKVYLPQGIIIPWIIGGNIWKINIRQSYGEPKYILVSGSANGLYNADSIYPNEPVIMVESELDALLLQSQLPESYAVVATGSASGSRLLRWVAEVKLASSILLAFDNDEAGENAFLWWHKRLKDKSQRLTPIHHDVTDMMHAGVDLQAWVMDALSATDKP